MWKTDDEKAIKFLNRAVTLGLEIESIGILGKKSMYLIRKNTDEHILYIPGDITNLIAMTQPLVDIRGILRVVGGESIKTYSSLFNYLRLDILDLSKLNTSNCVSMKGMFAYSRIKQIIFGENWNTSNVKDMSSMFSNLNINLFSYEERYTEAEFDLNNWNMENVEDISHMFYATSLKSLKINKWNLKPGVIATAMLDHIVLVEPLDLRGIYLRKITLASNDKSFNMNLVKYTNIKEIIIDKEDYDNRFVKKFIESLKSGAKITVVDNGTKMEYK